MSRSIARFAIDSFTKCLAAVLILLQVGYGLPAHAAPSVRATKSVPRQSSLLRAATRQLDAAQVSLAGLKSRATLAADDALAPLHAPGDFARLSSQFEEPLIAMAPSSAREDKALLLVLERFRDRAQEDNFTSLTGFLHEHPQSPWRVALLTNVGLLNYHYGYFQRAIDAYAEAWKEGRSATDPKSKALVDRAVGELARMHARLGHVPELEALFKEIGNRPISGPATEAIAGAREGLATMHSDPGVSFLCGPFALKNLLLAQGYQPDRIAFLDAFRSSPQGVSFQQVSDLAL